MLDDKTKNQIKKLHSQWQQQANKSKALNKKFITVSGEEVNYHPQRGGLNLVPLEGGLN